MRDWVLFQGLPEAAVHRKTTRAIQTERNVLPGSAAPPAMPCLALEIDSISSG